MRNRNQTQTAMGCDETTEPTLRVLVAIANPNREVEGVDPVVCPGAAELISPPQALARRDRHLIQIRIRGAQSPAVVNRHRKHAGHIAGEGNRPAVRCTDSCTGINAEVDTPMTAIAADRGIVAYYVRGYRNIQSGARC